MFLFDLSIAGQDKLAVSKKSQKQHNIHLERKVAVEDDGRRSTPCSSAITCSFLISFLRSASYFSFWFALAALWS